jgi:hypothetical protein
MKNILILLSCLIYTNAIAENFEKVDITPENARQYQVTHYVRDMHPGLMHTFEFPEKIILNKKEAPGMAVVNVAYDGQNDTQKKDTVVIPQYTTFASIIGSDKGLKESFITITYGSQTGSVKVYSISLNDWIHVRP